MLKQLTGIAHRWMPVGATSFARRLLPNRVKVWLRRGLTGRMTDTPTVTAKDGRVFKTIDDGLFFRVFYEGVYEPELTLVFARYLRADDLILDVGGSFGWYATLFGGCASKGQVRSYEPVPDTYEVLCENIRLNNQQQVVTPHQLCVGRECGAVSFVRTGNSGLGHVATGAETDTFDIPLVKLDDHACDWSSRVALLKVHVEGFELDVLKGASALLEAKVQPVVQVKLTDDRLKRYGVHRDDIAQELRSHGLSLYELTGDGRVVPTDKPVSHEIFGIGRGPFAARFRELFG